MVQSREGPPPPCTQRECQKHLVVTVTQQSATLARVTDDELPTKGRTNPLRMAIETVLALHSPNMHKF